MGGLALRWSWRCPWWCSQFRTQFQSYARILVSAEVVSIRTWCTAQLTAWLDRHPSTSLIPMLFSSPVYLICFLTFWCRLNFPTKYRRMTCERAELGKPNRGSWQDMILFPYYWQFLWSIAFVLSSVRTKKVNDGCLLSTVYWDEMIPTNVVYTDELPVPAGLICSFPGCTFHLYISNCQCMNNCSDDDRQNHHKIIIVSVWTIVSAYSSQNQGIFTYGDRQGKLEVILFSVDGQLWLCFPVGSCRYCCSWIVVLLKHMHAWIIRIYLYCLVNILKLW